MLTYISVALMHQEVLTVSADTTGADVLPSCSILLKIKALLPHDWTGVVYICVHQGPPLMCCLSVAWSFVFSLALAGPNPLGLHWMLPACSSILAWTARY